MNAIDRVKAFLVARATMRGQIDPNVVHEIHVGGERLSLAVEDLEAILAKPTTVYVLLAGVDSDDGWHQSLGSVHATPEGAMARVVAEYPGKDIKWEHHDSHGEAWSCKFYRSPFWHEFCVVAADVSRERGSQ